MKLLVGTLYTIENEFQDCLASLERQTLRDFDHFVIQGMPNRQAHDQLYERFMNNAGEYDFFIKLDADMVIRSQHLLADIVTEFEQRPQIDLLTILVHDYFTDRLVEGLHTFRSHVRWQKRTDDVFTDSHSIPRDRIFVDRDQLAPAAYHCPDPSDFQSFHYGLHRGVKVRQAIQVPKKQPIQLVTRLEEIGIIWHRFQKLADKQLGLAALGAELGIRGDFTPAHICFTEPYARSEFEEKYSQWTNEQIALAVRRLRRSNRLKMPWLEMMRLGRKILLPLRPFILRIGS
jgi:hypothetical protein